MPTYNVNDSNEHGAEPVDDVDTKPAAPTSKLQKHRARATHAAKKVTLYVTLSPPSVTAGTGL